MIKHADVSRRIAGWRNADGGLIHLDQSIKVTSTFEASVMQVALWPRQMSKLKGLRNYLVGERALSATAGAGDDRQRLGGNADIDVL